MSKSLKNKNKYTEGRHNEGEKAFNPTLEFLAENRHIKVLFKHYSVGSRLQVDSKVYT